MFMIIHDQKKNNEKSINLLTCEYAWACAFVCVCVCEGVENNNKDKDQRI